MPAGGRASLTINLVSALGLEPPALVSLCELCKGVATM